MLRATPPSAVHRAVLHWAVLHCAVPDCLVLDRPACRHPPRRAEECHINFFEKMDLPSLSPAQARAVAAIRAELARLVRYDDESVVHDRWVRQRYDGYYAVSYLPARSAAVVTAWHEAGHAVAALAVGARFRSASIYHATDSSGRVHGISAGQDQAFVVDAAGQLAERLRDWTLPGSDAELRTWLAGGETDR